MLLAPSSASHAATGAFPARVEIDGSALAAGPIAQEPEAPGGGRGALDVDERFLEELRKALAADRYFKAIDYAVVEDYAPLVVLVQKPRRPQEGWELYPSRAFGPWVQTLADEFRARYVEPLGLEPRPGRERLALCVLESPGDFVNYERAPGVRQRAWIEGGTAFDPALGLVVCDAETGSTAPHRKRAPVLLQAARGLVRAYHAGEHPWPESLMVSWGLPGYLATNLGTRPESLRERQLDRAGLRRVAEVLLDPPRRDVLLLGLEELLAARSTDDIEAAVRTRAEARGTPSVDSGLAQRLAYDVSILWMHYLQDGDDGRRRDASVALLGAVLSGEPALPAFRARFVDVEPRELERGFTAWTLARAAELQLAPKLVPEQLEAVLDARAGAAPEVEAPFVPARLAPAPDDALLRHALALALARRGDLAGAARELEAALEHAATGPFGRRLQRELVRVRAFDALRAAWLAELVRTRDRLRLELEGRRLNVRLTRVEPDRVVLDEERNGLDALPLSELDSYEVARQMGREVAGRDSGWARVYPYVLAGDERWPRLLGDESEQARELHDDAQEWLPGLLELARAAERLHALAERPVPADRDAAVATLALVETLLAEDGEREAVAARRDDLRRLASLALELLYDGEEVLAGLRGAVTRGDGAAVRIAYAFDDPAELSDFELSSGYPPERLEQAPALATSFGSGDFVVRGGALRGAGSATWRHALAFDGPIRVLLRLKLGQVPANGIPEVFWVLGACDDGKEAFLGLYDMGSVIAVDRAARFLSWAAVEGGQQLSTRQSYTLQLDFDGARVTSRLDGVEVRSTDAGPLRSGDVFLSYHGDTPVEVEALEIEGTPSAERIRARWLARRLGDLGLAAD